MAGTGRKDEGSALGRGLVVHMNYFISIRERGGKMGMMKIVADLHLHSKYSRAVSQEMVIRGMAEWARKKGIGLLGTGDWFHPLWMAELKANLEEIGAGIYQEKNGAGEVKFVLAAEISNIYKQGERQRRIHNLILVPNFGVAEKVNEALVKRGGNLSSDGRPIIGLTSKELLALVLSISEEVMLIPCHVWTPWYALYGSRSGFDSIEEAFGSLGERIWAVETGLSSDPEMNWRIKELKRRAIVSFSDAHSPAKLGREAVVFQVQSSKLKVKSFSYRDVYEAIGERYRGKNEGKLRLAYTIEFHPEEGKYHYTGHRKCGVVQSPEETRKRGITCPVCGRPLTVGVMHRVDELSGGKEVGVKKSSGKSGVMGYFHPQDPSRPPYVMLVPLMEVLAEVLQTGVSSKGVVQKYESLINQFGGEFKVLMETELGQLASVGEERLAEAIKRVRSGEVVINPGYDGEFGKVSIWPQGEQEEKRTEQMGLF